VEDILDNDPEYIHWVREKAYSEPLSSYIKNLIDYDLEEYDRLRAMASPSMTSEEILFQRALQHKLKYKTFNLERYFEWLKAASNRAKGWLAVKEFSESTRRMRWEAWAQHPDNPKNVGLDQPPVPYSGTHEAPLNPDPGSMTGSTRQMPPDRARNDAEWELDVGTDKPSAALFAISSIGTKASNVFSKDANSV
jgi:hypothetical protein